MWVRRERTSRVVPSLGLLINLVVTVVAAAAVFAAWVANRKRIAAETIGRAEQQALRIVKDAERDAETMKKEALLEAKEKAHEVLVEAERQARQERQQSATLEQTLTRREAALTERQAAIERLEKELNAPRPVAQRARKIGGRCVGPVRTAGRARSSASSNASPGSRPTKPRTCWSSRWKARRVTTPPICSSGSTPKRAKLPWIAPSTTSPKPFSGAQPSTPSKPRSL